MIRDSSGIGASVGALVALAFRTDLASAGRGVGATAIFAVIYAGRGVLVGAVVRSELNGSLIVVFAWIFDVFFGPAMGGTAAVLRLLPLRAPPFEGLSPTSSRVQLCLLPPAPTTCSRQDLPSGQFQARNRRPVARM